MEDAHTCVVSLGPMKWSFFAVFDGHAGKIAAEICSRELVDKIEQVLTDDVLKVCFWAFGATVTSFSGIDRLW
jgi:serine/threonine protein phosphatase PrpC